MANSLVKLIRSGQKSMNLLERSSAGAISAQRDLHLSQPRQGTLEMPERLIHIPDAEVWEK